MRLFTAFRRFGVSDKARFEPALHEYTVCVSHFRPIDDLCGKTALAPTGVEIDVSAGVRTNARDGSVPRMEHLA